MEHLTQKQCADYSQSRLTSWELFAVTDHLSECETCRQLLQTMLNIDDAFLGFHSEIFESSNGSAGPVASSHLSSEQAAGYVDKDLSADELQTARDHLMSCELCNLAIKDLQTFRNEIAPSVDHEYKPARIASRASWWQRTVHTFPAWFQSPVPVVSAALALLVFAGVGWMIWRNWSGQVPAQEIAALPSSSPEMPLPQPAPSQQPPEQVTAKLHLNDGGRQLTLDQNGSLTGAEDLPATYQTLIKKALSSGRIERSSQLNGLSRPASSLMSSDKTGASFSVKEPVGNVLLSDRPTFRWSRLEGASSYFVEVYDNKFQLILQSPSITVESWTTNHSLPRGAIYNWQVRAVKNGEEITSPRPPAVQAKFRVLDQTRATQIAKAKQATPPSRLSLALLYADAGLFDESAEQLRQLQRENPNAGIVSNLLRQVQSFKRRR